MYNNLLVHIRIPKIYRFFFMNVCFTWDVNIYRLPKYYTLQFGSVYSVRCSFECHEKKWRKKRNKKEKNDQKIVIFSLLLVACHVKYIFCIWTLLMIFDIEMHFISERTDWHSTRSMIFLTLTHSHIAYAPIFLSPFFCFVFFFLC